MPRIPTPVSSQQSLVLALFVSIALWISGCAASLSGQLSGPELSAESLGDARINVTRLDAAPDEGVLDEPASVILVPGKDGAFATTGKLLPGRYLVEALVPGYEPVSRQIDFKEPQNIQLSLVPLGKAKARTSEINENAAPSRGAGGATLTLPQF